MSDTPFAEHPPRPAPRARAVLVCALAFGTLTVGPGCRAQTPAPSPTDALAPQPRSKAPALGELQATAAADSPYEEQTPSADGTGRFYMGREIARYMSHRGAAWLEREDRERTERPDDVVDALGLEPGDTVADLGAGTGYFTLRLAREVPDGRVLAVDIQPEMLEIVARRAAEERIPNVETVLGTESDPRLPPNAVDLTLLVDAYHEFGYPREVMRALYRATRPGGRVVLIEYRAEDPAVAIKPLHKMTEAQVRREVEAVGFRLVENRDFLPQQHFLVFEKARGD